MKILFEMAYSKQRALNKLSQYSDQRILHLIKLFIYFELRSSDIQHWINEIYNWSGYSPSLKGRKLLRRSEIYKVIWKEPQDDWKGKKLEIRLDSLYRDGYPQLNYDESILHEFLTEFHTWLADNLSTGDIQRDDFQKNLIEIINKYK